MDALPGRSGAQPVSAARLLAAARRTTSSPLARLQPRKTSPTRKQPPRKKQRLESPSPSSSISSSSTSEPATLPSHIGDIPIVTPGGGRRVRVRALVAQPEHAQLTIEELALDDEKNNRIAPPFHIERPYVDTQGKRISSSPRRSTASSSPASHLSPSHARSASDNRDVSSTPPRYIRAVTRLHPPDSSWHIEKTQHVPVAELEAQSETKIDWCIHVELNQREDGQGVRQYFFQDVDRPASVKAALFPSDKKLYDDLSKKLVVGRIYGIAATRLKPDPIWRGGAFIGSQLVFSRYSRVWELEVEE